MIDAIVFPKRLLVMDSQSWNRRGQTVSPGQTAIGTFPRGSMDGGGLWVANMSLVLPYEQDDVLCYRAVRNLCDGGLRAMIVPRMEINTGFPPWPVIGGVTVRSYSAIPHSDGTFFSDGSGYYRPVIVVETVGAALLRDTSLTLHITSGSALRGGECFSIEHAINNWRHYEITTVEIDGSGNSVVGIRPPLREDTPSGTRPDFDNPRCTMFLATAQAMDLTVTPEPYVHPSVSFIEYPWMA